MPELSTCQRALPALLTLLAAIVLAGLGATAAGAADPPQATTVQVPPLPAMTAALQARILLCQHRRAQAAESGRPQAPADRNGGKGLLRIGGLVQRPMKVYTPAPAYTETAHKARLQGVVILEAILDRYGCLEDIQVLKGLPMGLSEAALDAVQTWVFDPATLDGEPVDIDYTLTVSFQVQEEPPRPPS